MPVHFDAILGLGSNIGDKAANIEAAIASLDAAPDTRVVVRSRLFRTPPWGVTDQDSFANACIGIATKLEPRDLLRRCQQVENDMGRVRERRWGPRVIDVDVLVYGDRRISEPHLVVPHPRITERAFVLAPLADIAPDLVLSGRTVKQWLEAVDRAGVEPWTSAI